MTTFAAGDRFVLREDVRLFRALQLSPRLRSLLRAAPGDVLVVLGGSRSTSKLIEEPSALLLEQFRLPSDVEQALSHIGVSIDPEVRRQANDFVAQLVAAGFLLPADHARVDLPELLAPGDYVGDLQIRAPLQLMDDAQVYLVSQPDGSKAILKTATNAGSAGQAMLRHEAAVLRAIAGSPAPELLAADREGDNPFLLVEYCLGSNVAVAADDIRAISSDSGHRLVDLGYAVLDAYRRLHEMGIIHGDVSISNVLVHPESNEVRIIDFGLACRLLPEDESLRATMRGGNPYYFAPEHASALLNRQEPPACSLLAEQYSIAVLLYRVLTGRYYLVEEGDEAAVLQRIVSDPPLPFPRGPSRQLLAVERVLRRALAKDGADRFPSLGDFARALRRAGEASFRRPSFRIANSVDPQRFPAIVARYSDSECIVAGLPAPAASVYHGAAGLAFFLYRAAIVTGQPRLVAVADQWIDRAKTASIRGEALYSEPLGVTEAQVGRKSLHHGEAGLACVEAKVCCSLGNLTEARLLANEFAYGVGEETRTDLLTGAAGSLLACTILTETLAIAGAGSEQLNTAGTRLLAHLWERNEQNQEPSIGATEYLGIAHGLAGRLYASLRWVTACGQRLPETATAHLEHLSNLARRQGHHAHWPATAAGGEPWSGWCHGSAGYTHLWAVAYAATGSVRYHDLALAAAGDSWSRTHSLGHLCCGSAGQAYAMLAAYDLTGSGMWVDRARALLQRALTQTAGLRPGGLYTGDAGIALLEAELTHPDTAAMPLFAPER